MKDVPAELLYVLIFLAIVLFQYLMKRFGPQAPPEPAWDERLEQIPEAPEDAPAASAVSAPVAGGFGRSAAPEASRAPPRRRFSRASLLGGRREVQNAVVVATILGPCRAFEPHDIRQ
ncbi:MULTISPECIES: hypothetical protein [unclassified Thauera]|uniref:hypothetical protein n=1 Tax=unclassified Thauera TaxID=2609274 RepID=UPI0022DE533C|nr:MULTISPECIES: hypothetical protein [unclassified Thauera]WBL64130.1 hypothetical protein LQF09_19020 [Thauera sp. WB-2]